MMQALLISKNKTLSYDNIVDIIANTQDWKQHITNSNGSVNDIKRWKIHFLIKKHGSPDQLETLSVHVDDGIAYVENKTINIVANIRDKH